MKTVTVTVDHEAGLHARPLSQFVRTAKKFQADVRVSNVTIGKGPASGKSPLNLLLLAVSQGHEIQLEADGPDADQALAALAALVENNFVA